MEDPEAQRRGTKFVYQALSDGKLAPNIDRVYPMEQYKEAWGYMKGPRSSYGKVVVETGA